MSFAEFYPAFYALNPPNRGKKFVPFDDEEREILNEMLARSKQ